MKKLVFALCSFVAIISMASCTADSIDEPKPSTNKSADLIIDPGIDPTKKP